MLSFRPFLLLLVVLLAACADDDEAPAPAQRPLQVTLSVPAGYVAQRGIGDPGAAVTYRLPAYLRFYVCTSGSQGARVASEALTLVPESDWMLSLDGLRYVYTGALSLYVPDGTTAGRVYAVASYHPLTLPDAPDTEAAVQSLTLDLTQQGEAFAGDALALRDVYANPADAPGNGALTRLADDHYSATIVCNHVAALVDFQWDVNPAQPADRGVRALLVRAPLTTGYLFRPSANEATFPASTQPLPVVAATTPANRRYGRAAVYVLQPAGARLDYTLTTEAGATTTDHALTAQPADAGEVDPAYAAWYKINVRLGY